uniref:Neurogenic locus Notch protein n=1 Tax=Steinernema glaseri TaxID=37863 RepID=A0A1I7Z6V8_9BILA
MGFRKRLLFAAIVFLALFRAVECATLKVEDKSVCSANFGCRNNGTCLTIEAGYRCECPKPWAGVHCELLTVHQCPSEPCFNGGSCRIRSGQAGFECLCPIGFQGSLCEEPISSICTTASPCGAHGDCKLISATDPSAHECLCHPGFFGTNCTQIDHCHSNPCHYGRCVSRSDKLDDVDEFKCECPAGRRGKLCEQDVNECHEQPAICGTRGRCVNTLGSYYCSCPPGLMGPGCATSFVGCDPNPCQNSATCVAYGEHNEKHSCECKPGFTGRNCEVNIDECSFHSRPCNNGTCVDGVNGFTCHCPPGTTGQFCEVDVDECATGEAVCQNGGTCVNEDNGYKCVCIYGWKGEHCEENVDDCGKNMCHAGSKCIDGLAKYTCECQPGRMGVYCHLEDPCFNNPCGKDAMCLKDVIYGNYSCVCPMGLTGPTCTDDINECLDPEASRWCNPGNGVCVNTFGGFHCECNPGYTDPWCGTLIDSCDPNPCLNGATCFNGVEDSFQCICLPGFTGDKCETPVCSAKTCYNGGVCNANGTCSCPKGYSGYNCDFSNLDYKVCVDHKCEHGGICVPDRAKIGGYRCSCVDGFNGQFCSFPPNQCAANPCQHGGSCSNRKGGYECACPRGYSGKDCEVNVDDCASQPCQNSGICIDGIDSFVCHCDAPYTGRFCENRIDPCLGNKCRNSAICQPTTDYRNYTCQCQSGFDGRFCEEDINECASMKPCQNGASCSNGYGGYRCTCLAGFTGFNCDVNVDDCARNPCMNYGRCVDQVNGFKCECELGFTGSRCEVNVNDCEKNECRNGATCVDKINGYECACKRGFSGRFCEINDNDCVPGLCLNGGSCIDGVNSYRCACEQNYTGRNCQQKVDLGYFNRTDHHEYELCKKHKCAEKSHDGRCDPECNFYICDFDGGDCSAGQKPFEKCERASYCSRTFRDGKCDPACDNEACLFDGFDCGSTIEKVCKNYDYCKRRFSDGHCDKECDMAACGFDGGDCQDEKSSSSSLPGGIEMIFVTSPEHFFASVNQLLMTMNQQFRAVVRFKTDGKGNPMIYEWDSVHNRGALIKPSAEIAKKHLDKREAVLRGILVVFSVNVDICHAIDPLQCFSDVDSVAALAGAASLKKDFDEMGLHVYSAISMKPSAPEESKMNYLFYIIGIPLMFALAVFGVVQSRDRKRKTLNAPIWGIPPENASIKSYNGTGYGYAYYDLLGEQSHKRARIMTGFPEEANSSTTTISSATSSEKSTWKRTALHEALEGDTPLKHVPSAHFLGSKDEHGQTPLIVAVLNKNKDEEVVASEVKLLLQAGTTHGISFVDEQDNEGKTALIHAIDGARDSVVEVLLVDGMADPKISDNEGRTPLHYACALNSYVAVQMLLASKKIGDDVDFTDSKNRTPLMMYAMHGTDRRIGEALLDAGADKNCAGVKECMNYTGVTPLHLAAQHNNFDAVVLLLERDVTKDAQDEREMTPLMLAAKNGHEAIVKKLLDEGASRDMTNQVSQTAMDLAKIEHHAGVVQIFNTTPDFFPRMPQNRAGGTALPATQQKRITQKSAAARRTQSMRNKNKPANNSPVYAVPHNPLTPPLSDGSSSTYSTTPSPPYHQNHVRGGVYPGATNMMPDQKLHGSSVLMSPFSPQHTLGINQAAHWHQQSPPYEDYHQQAQNSFQYSVAYSGPFYSQGPCA